MFGADGIVGGSIMQSLLTDRPTSGLAARFVSHLTVMSNIALTAVFRR